MGSENNGTARSVLGPPVTVCRRCGVILGATRLECLVLVSSLPGLCAEDTGHWLGNTVGTTHHCPNTGGGVNMGWAGTK